MKMVSYAQNGEDVMLARALRDVAHGFYIDAGAAGPTEHSVTRAFYDRGWTGINIEPTERYFAELAAARPHDVNLHVALDAEAGETTLFAFEGTGLSTLDPAIADGHKPGGWPMARVVTATRTLADICAEYAPPTVHFLKVDVEGVEDRVLRGADFSRCRPWIVVVEATRPMSPEPDYAGWEPLLTGAGYEFVWFDGLNRFYLAAEKTAELRRHFAVPVNFFDDFDLYNPQIERSLTEASASRSRAEAAESRAQAAESRAQASDIAIADLRGRAERAEAEAALARAAANSAGALAQVADAAAAAARDRLGELQGHVAELHRRLDEGRIREAAAQQHLALQRGDYESRLAAQHADLHGRRLAQEHAEAVAANLSGRIRQLEHEAAALREPPPAASARVAPGGGVKNLLLAVYRALFRPVVRPVMWRTRSFLVNALLHEQLRQRDEHRHALGELSGRTDRVHEALQRLEGTVVPLRALLDRPDAAAGSSQEWAALARSLETALLTLAVTARVVRPAAE